MQFPERLARAIFAQLTPENINFAQRLCETMSLPMGLEPFNAWHQRREQLQLSKSRHNFMTASHGSSPQTAILEHIPQISNLGEAKFVAGVVEITDVPVDLREPMLDLWDQALVRIGTSWSDVDFDIAGHLEYNREMAEAA